MRGHAPFAIWNRSGNRAVAWMLASPLSPLLDRRLALITVTGRRTRREFTLPVSYERDGDAITIPVLWPARKLWWRNLRGDGAPVRVILRGRQQTGHAVVHGDENSSVTVRVALD